MTNDRDTIPVRLPSGTKAVLDLPRPLTVADATHLCTWIVQYVEGPQAEEAQALVTPNASMIRDQRRLPTMSNTPKQPAVGPRLDATVRRQRVVDDFCAAHGPCCAGCDWWRHYNSMVGECIRSAPVSGADRVAMLGIESTSLAPGAGHVMTRRDHHCGEFRDVGPDA